MQYGLLPESLILNYELLKIAIFEETKFLFEDRPYILEQWQQEAYSMSDEEVKAQEPDDNMGPSFRALFSLFTQTLYFQQHITKQMVQDAVKQYKDSIKVILAGHFINEFPLYGVDKSVNDEKITEVLNQDYIYSSMDRDFHLMRDIVTKKKNFKKGEDGLLATKIIDNSGKVRGMAELRPLKSTEIAPEQQAVWLELIESTINSLDEMTADLFDLITYLWMVSPKTEDGFIEFHCNDALRLRNLKKRSARGREIDYREEDRFNIMKRVAALSSIWINLGDQKIEVITSQDIKDNELYKFKDFQRMFEISTIRVAYDKKTGESKGIYAVLIKPTSILTPYLDLANSTLGVLNVKVFQYSHFTQREHKRLIRYLNLQWKIRTLKNTLQQPFKVSTLLKVIDISSRYNGVQKRDKFESVLDELQKDQVIKSWSYNEEINEGQIGKKGWFENYWTKINVTILPTDSVVQENLKKLTIDTNQVAHANLIQRVNQQKKSNKFQHSTIESSNLIPKPLTTAANPESIEEEHSEQQSFNFSQDEILLSPEIMKKTMETMNMSIRQTAEEIGIAHTTLSRYLRNENKRQNNKNDEKMLNWLKEKTLIYK